MKKILSASGYIWAFICLLIVMTTFIQNDLWSKQLAQLSFMKVHPKYSGGELNRRFVSNGMVVLVNYPVETTLFSNGRKQHVQITFSPIDSLPEIIDQTIDYNFDGNPDFNISINTITGRTKLDPVDATVKSLYASSLVHKNWVIRVNLSNP